MEDQPCKKTELNKLKGETNKIILAIDGKNDGHQRELLKVLLKLNLSDNQLSLLGYLSTYLARYPKTIFGSNKCL